jgi:hypothetical protein
LLVSQEQTRIQEERATTKSLEQKRRRRSVKPMVSAANLMQLIQEKIRDMVLKPDAEEKKIQIAKKKQNMLRPTKLAQEIYSYADV